jgi:hypothetical protein
LDEGATVAKPDYQFQKRQKELQKKKKMEQKRQRKLEQHVTPSGQNPDPVPGSGRGCHEQRQFKELA